MTSPMPPTRLLTARASLTQSEMIIDLIWNIGAARGTKLTACTDGRARATR
jgi:hypothetical protein